MVVGEEDPDVDRVAVDELEEQFPAMVRINGRHTHFFLNFPNCSDARGLPFFEPASRSVDLAGTQAPPLADEEQFVAALNEQEGRLVDRFPGRPVNLELSVAGLERRSSSAALIRRRIPGGLLFGGAGVDEAGKSLELLSHDAIDPGRPCVETAINIAANGIGDVDCGPGV